MEILSLEEGVDAKYAEIRTAIVKAGTPIETNDYLFAAQGRTLTPVSTPACGISRGERC